MGNFLYVFIRLVPIKLEKCVGKVLSHSPCKPGPEVIKLFSCSAQLRLKFILFINVKMPTNV